MNFNTRSLGLALLLLLLFIGAAVTLQWWLHRETRVLQNMAIEDLRSRLNLVVAANGRQSGQWDEAFQRELGAMLGGTVEFIRPGKTPKSLPASTALTFTQAMPDAPGWQVQVRFATPAMLRVQMLNQRILAVIVLLALLLALVPLFSVLLDTRRSLAPEGGTRTPWAAARAQAIGMEHFAKISNERTVELAEEHGARMRAEENLQVNRTMLDQSVDERIRLGRELHDNICQTLYAVCLTLESVQKKNTLAPLLKERVDQCMIELRRLNQEVRAYILDLEPARMQGHSFTSAVAAMINAFTAEDTVKFEDRLDPDAVALIPTSQTADVMNILREAVSNGVRHGHARTITLLAGRSDREIALAVQDDGTGFAGNGGSLGHGLSNMQARAASLGGSLRIESTPGKGTRILLTLPVASPV